MATILVVDDSMLVRRLTKAAFQASGHQVVEAENGRQAFARLRTRPEIAAVVSDLNMPGIGGMALLARVRQFPQWATLPIILVTADMDPALIQRAKVLGASGWVVKPCKPGQLVALTEKLLLARSATPPDPEHHRGGAPCEPQAADDSARSTATLTTSGVNGASRTSTP